MYSESKIIIEPRANKGKFYHLLLACFILKEGKDICMENVKVIWTAVLSAIMSFLGVLAVPVMLMVGCNVLDYITGLIASRYRDEEISSYKGIRGIIKKVCMWMLVLIGSWIDMLMKYAVEYIGADFKLPFIVATVVCVWIVVNEMISILENMIDIGVELPPFLMPLAKRIKITVENTMEEEQDE